MAEKKENKHLELSQLIFIEHLICTKLCSRCGRHGSEQNKVSLPRKGDVLVEEALTDE